MFEDNIEAWQYGSVVPTVYHVCKVFQSNEAIVENISNSSSIDATSKQKLMNKILDKLMEYNKKQWELVDISISHKEGGCWNKVVKERGKGAIITVDDIRNDNTTYFEYK